MAKKWNDMTKTERLDELRKAAQALAAKVSGLEQRLDAAVAHKKGAAKGKHKRSK
jgi:outer membrane murein-binding lipoprotein Lpp